MRFAYYQRLSERRKRTYRRSDAIEAVALPPGEPFAPRIERLMDALRAERRGEVEAICQQLIDDLCARLQVSPLRVKVSNVRPSGQWGELHGLYTPAQGRARAKIDVWMRTVARRQVVAFRSFLRTLLHELCHHLDYELFGLDETFHTEGFYKRESDLFRRLAGGPAQGELFAPAG